jgi:hypothetical protein
MANLRVVAAAALEVLTARRGEWLTVEEILEGVNAHVVGATRKDVLQSLTDSRIERTGGQGREKYSLGTPQPSRMNKTAHARL